MSEQDVLKFCEITGASPEEARNFLQVQQSEESYRSKSPFI